VGGDGAQRQGGRHDGDAGCMITPAAAAGVGGPACCAWREEAGSPHGGLQVPNRLGCCDSSALSGIRW
jgi:hypothetical protein